MNIREPQYFAQPPVSVARRKQRLPAGLLVVTCWLVAAGLIVGLTTGVGGERPAPLAAERIAPKLQPKAPPVKPFEFPAGGRTLTPAYRFVALYGSPDMPALGALGEQGIAESIARAKDLAAQYQTLTAEHVYPTLEIITTVASAGPTDNGDYSQELEVSKLQPWIDEAGKAGVYVTLDLQPGRSDFLSQAKQYESLLSLPYVGLALDPEWRLAPDQLHLQQIGSVGIEEVNQVAVWLADVTKAHLLPQKLFLLHQFQLAMIQNRQALNVSHSELAYVIQMDGSGPQHTKLDTWNTIRQESPANVSFGWKNFYHEDPAPLDPAGTMAITPQPWYVSYQ